MNTFAIVPILDDIIVIRKDGKYKITKVTEKQFVGKISTMWVCLKGMMTVLSITFFIATEKAGQFI